MNVLSVSVTDRGRSFAHKLGFAHVHGEAASTVRERWHDVEAFVLFIAVGAAMRIVAPLLDDKHTDPAVVCVDEAGRFAVALCGGHERGGNLLAHRVAHAIGADPVVTTATEAVGTRLVAGIGSSTDATLDDITAALIAVVGGRVPELVATIDRRADLVAGLGLPVASFAPETLADVDVPSPSAVVDAAVGTPSVAEAAAVLGAGTGSELVVPKTKAGNVTVAVARRAVGRGRLAVVGLGPGAVAHRTPAAAAAVRNADVVIGYEPYVRQCVDLIGPHHEVIPSPIGDEAVRAKQALAEAAAGRNVALVCTGDAGVYAMASVVFEHADDDVDVNVVPGVTAGTAAAAMLGSPLGHDHAVVSLSDLRTPWDLIERRLRAAGEADLVTVLYNPRSVGRPWQLSAAIDILLAHRPGSTPVGIVKDAGRPGQRVDVTSLGGLDVESVDMRTCVIIGSSQTKLVAGRMVTPR